MYKAYEVGRLDCDPSENWYKDEINFFDFLIIRLAKKLKECGFFGVSSDEDLIYAQQNRNEWEQRGEGIVAQMKQSPVGCLCVRVEKVTRPFLGKILIA